MTGCISKQAWVQAQLACNAGDAASCALVFKPGCPGPSPVCAQSPDTPIPVCPEPSPCPSGQSILCPKPPRQGNNGQWSTTNICYCASPYAPAAVTASAKNHWGLYLGLGIAAFVVYKVATG